MSQELISRNPDLKKLRDEGYEIDIKNGHLLVYHVPYVNPGRAVAFGVLVAPLGNMVGDQVGRPQDHTIYFAGDLPCDSQGNVIRGILNSSQKKALAERVEVDHYFSAKPQTGSYENYYDKITAYDRILSSNAAAIDPSATAKTFKVIESTDASTVFNYWDTNSSRAEIEAISAKLKNLKIAIIGLGGTGSYVLDFVAKTPVSEIHLFDVDDFLSHNAFRAPGAPSIEVLKGRPKKVSYLHGIYSKMHQHVIPHEYHLTPAVLEELSGVNFAFICIDEGESKKSIVQKLLEVGIPFVDTGIGINAVDGLLTGGVRVTAVTPKKSDHIPTRIPFSGKGDDDYDKNVQIAEVNALAAALAVIKWKKLFGFYHDLEGEHNTVYSINCSQLVNDEKADS